MRVIITGYTDPSAMAQAINEAGIHQFLTKPGHLDQLPMAARNGTHLFQLARLNERMALEMRFLASIKRQTGQAPNWTSARPRCATGWV